MNILGTCQACEAPNVRLASCTNDCACLVCERCANQFLQDGVCGICGTTFTDDNPEDVEEA